MSLQVDDSAVVGNSVNFVVREKAKGGLLTLGLTGDFFRVWEAEPQVRPELTWLFQPVCVHLL